MPGQADILMPHPPCSGIESADTPTPGRLLAAGTVHVWSAWLDQPQGAVEHFRGLLSVDERERAGRFRFAQHERHFVVGRGLLRTFLASYLAIHPAAVRFSYGARGKPVLAADCSTGDLRFNLSHSHGLAVCALARGRDVGVDVEWVHPLPDLEQVAWRFFSTRENGVLQNLPAEDKPQGFFNCWTRKEAYVKACGEGLALPLDRFSVSLAPGRPARLLGTEDGWGETQRWRLQEFFPATGYTAALAVEGQDWTYDCLTWPEGRARQGDLKA
jgi:4'-phosphopantetheinyl transferase